MTRTRGDCLVGGNKVVAEWNGSQSAWDTFVEALRDTPEGLTPLSSSLYIDTTHGPVHHTINVKRVCKRPDNFPDNMIL